MLVDIRSRTGRVTSGLRSYVHRARDMSLGRFRHRIREVIVRIPDGDVHTARECEVDLRLDGRSHVVARGRAADIYAAISRAFGRAARAVARRPEPRRIARALPPLQPMNPS